MFLPMDDVTGLEEGAKAIFPQATVQRCIVHLIRNSLKYVPIRDYKAFTATLKRSYAALSLAAAKSEFERYQDAWKATNALESVDSSLWIVIRKGVFLNESTLLKLLFLRVKELEKKWGDRPLPNWELVRNQLEMDDAICRRIQALALD